MPTIINLFVTNARNLDTLFDEIFNTFPCILGYFSLLKKEKVCANHIYFMTKGPSHYGKLKFKKEV